MSSQAQDTKQRGFVSLDQIIRSALMDIGESIHRYEQFKHWAIDAVRDYHMDLSREVKTVRLSLTAWKSVELPDDFVDWALIGVEIDNDIQVFTNDERIPLPTIDADEDGELDAPTVAPEFPVDQIPGGLARYYFWNTTSRGEDVGQLYGLTVKDNGIGYWKMNTERREIQFTPSLNADTVIYLEYISDGFNPCEATTVNLYAAKLVRLYIHWQRLKFSKYPRAHVAEAKDDYWAEYYKVQSRLNPITVADVLECARNGYKLISSF